MGRPMSKKVVPLQPTGPVAAPTSDDLVRRIRELSSDTANIRFDHPHVQGRLAQRGLTMRQVLETLRRGAAVSSPDRDKYGDWRVKLKRRVAGRRVQVVVACKEDHVVVVTAI